MRLPDSWIKLALTYGLIFNPTKVLVSISIGLNSLGSYTENFILYFLNSYLFSYTY